MRRAIVAIIMTVAVLVIIATQLIRLFQEANPIAQPTMRTYTSSAIVQQVQPLGQLVTYRMPFAKANIEVIVSYGVANVCRIGALHTAEGLVEAGIDLQQLNPESISFDSTTNTYQIKLPAAQITSCSLDPMNVVQYHTFGEVVVACPADMDEIRRMASYVAINDFRDAALEIGILEEAQGQARQVIQSFVQGLTGATVEISFEQTPDQSVLPGSCEPNPPGNWIYEAETKEWRQE